MKKLLGVSIVAMLAVMPMMAHAAGETPTAATASSDPYLGVTVADGDKSNIASTAYVKGAYNAAIGAVNGLSTKKQDNLKNSSNGAISSTVKTTVGEATGDDAADDTSLVTEKAVRDAIDAVSSAAATSGGAGISKNGSVIAVDMTQNGGLQMTGEGASATLGVKVNTATMNLDTNGIGIKDAGVDSAQLADSAVTNTKIAANAVTAAKLDTNAVTTDKILNSNVTTDKLADSSITTLKIANANVTAEKLASNAVTTDKILNSNVTTDKIADSAVTYAKLDSGLVQGSIRSATAAAEDADSAAYAAGQTVASEKAVADAITASKVGMATQSGVVATINSAVPTIRIYDTWNATTTTAVSGTIAVPNNAYVSGS